jgi:predicted DNA-binding transcriptional regulator AlpA
VSQTAHVIPFPTERRNARRLVPLSELQELLGYSERWWRYRMAEPGFPARKWGGRLRFDPAEVERWLDERYAHGKA